MLPSELLSQQLGMGTIDNGYSMLIKAFKSTSTMIKNSIPVLV